MRRNLPNLVRRSEREAKKNVLVISGPPSLPHGRRHLPSAVLRATMPVAMAINAVVMIRHVRRTLRALSVTSPILWLTDPYQVSLAGKLQDGRSLYESSAQFI